MSKLFSSALALALAVGPWHGRMRADERVALCHHPLGNPDNHQMIVVGPAAVPAHLAHGDHLHSMCPGHNHSD